MHIRRINYEHREHYKLRSSMTCSSSNIWLINSKRIGRAEEAVYTNEIRNAYRILIKNALIKGRVNLGYLGLHGRVLWKYILKKQGVKMWTVLNRLRIKYFIRVCWFSMIESNLFFPEVHFHLFGYLTQWIYSSTTSVKVNLPVRCMQTNIN